MDRPNSLSPRKEKDTGSMTDKTDGWIVSTDGMRAEVMRPERLRISIRHLDDDQASGLLNLDGREVILRDIEELLPNVRALSWTEVKCGGDLSVGEWYALDGGYRINIYGAPGSEMWHSEVMALWRRFLDESA